MRVLRVGALILLARLENAEVSSTTASYDTSATHSATHAGCQPACVACLHHVTPTLCPEILAKQGRAGAESQV